MKLFGFEINKAKEPVNLTQNSSKGLRKKINYETDLQRVRQDIKRWRTAIIYAESKSNPNRVELLRCYKDALLDAHLSACIDQRKNSILCRDFKIEVGEEENEEQTELFETAWFRKFVDLALDSRYFGFTLIDFGPMIDNEFPDIQAVPREYVCPEFQVVSQYQGGCDGIDITKPEFIPWNMFVGDKYDLGLLLKASSYTIWKKTSLGNWSEYNEKFGVPMRIGKTATSDNEQVTNMEDALKGAGSSFWAVIDTNDAIEFLDSEKSGAFEIFDKMIERSNSEISKLVLGQTGTTDEKSFVGSANVHYNVRQDIIESDAKFIEDLVNDKLIPWLNKYHGYNITGEFEYEFSQTMTMQEKADLVTKMMPYVQFSAEYLEKEFDIELSDEPVMEEPAAGKSQTSYENTISSYSFECKACGGSSFFEVVNIADDLEQIVLQGVWAGITTPKNLPVSLYNELTRLFEQALNEGYGSADDFNKNALYQELKISVRHFAAAKVYQQVTEISKLAGKYDTYQDFATAASSIYKQYNETWLATEYNTGRNAARAASDYKTYQIEKDLLSYLEYQTVGDARVRPEHAALDGITRQVDDSFWKSYYPPNGWGCRCTTIRHESHDETNLKGFKQPNDVPDLFLYNPALDETIFPSEHPYFDVTDKSFALQNFGLPL